jgi:uncharacterized protein YhaN
MILRSLELKHFGRFGEAGFEFRRGMNLIYGPNEAGKSTLMEAIPAVLFGVRDKERLRPWGRQGSCEAALVLEGGGGTVRVERDILADRVVLVEHDDLYQALYRFEGKVSPQGRSSERAEYVAQLQRLFGLAEEDIFRASLFFGQGSLEVSGGNLATKIKTLLSGFAEVDYDKVLASLSEDHFAITRQNPWGKDKTRERELDEVRTRLAAIEERWYAVRTSVQEAEDVRRRIGELEESIACDREEYSKGERYLAWVRRQWQLEEKEQVLIKDFSRVNRQSDKVQELEKERERLERELLKTGLPLQIPEELPHILTEADEVRSEMIDLQRRSAELRKEILSHPDPPWRAPAAVTAALWTTGFILASIFTDWRAAALVGAALLSAALGGIYLRRLMQERSERSRLKEKLKNLELQREEAQDRLAMLDERFVRIGMSPSAVETVRMQKNLLRHRELAEKLREVKSALAVLEPSTELSTEKEQLTRELAVLDERMEREKPLRPNVLPLEELPDAEEKLTALGESLREREKELLELSRREAVLSAELLDLKHLEEEGERLKEREVRLDRRRQALCTAYDLLSGAVDEFRGTYMERFAAEIGDYLQMTTRGRYSEVRLGEDFSLYLKGKGEAWVPADHFSRGTVDGIYLAVRLALTRHLSRGRHLPLLLDDPLVNLDRQRLEETLRALELLSAEHQVLLFTHSESLARRAARDRWNVVSLGEARTFPSAKLQSKTHERNEDVEQLCLL